MSIAIRGAWDNRESPPAVDPPAGCLMRIETSQVGSATHLGSFTGHGATCVTRTEQADTPPLWDKAPAPPYMVADFTNEMVWTTENGDDLWLGTDAGLFVMSEANGAATAEGRLTVTGGTGRFEGATGHLSAKGGRQPGEAGDHVRFEGELTLRPGSRANGS